MQLAKEGERMPGTIEFRYDKGRDIVVAVPKWRIRTREDCEVWFRQWADHLTGYGRKVDCVVVLDDFHVVGAIAAAWGEYRAKLNITYFRYSFRVNADPTVSLFCKTSGVRFNAAANEAPTVEDAIAGILDARKNAGT
jgi:hypothetical protein